MNEADNDNPQLNCCGSAPMPATRATARMMLLDRQAGDTISTVFLDPQPMGGTINLYAGWRVSDEPYSAPNEGYVPVPGQLLRAVVNAPGIAWWFWHDPGASAIMH